ncbi:hypothetical protein [Nonomuraea basaltis]|uniref:hypothetical protein n=1 Tax=Nonomuraea basaltis TaxID=2495887 RepID=UPI00110C5D59|nr:hypothetical protein [Nonomuraea basaltis]TMR91914.1 hypothetical protein EJK15_47395 [Nonomuraea basaltis]
MRFETTYGSRPLTLELEEGYRVVRSCTVSSSGLVGGSALPGRIHSTTTYFTSPLSGYKWGAHGGRRRTCHWPAW